MDAINRALTNEFGEQGASNIIDMMGEDTPGILRAFTQALESRIENFLNGDDIVCMEARSNGFWIDVRWSTGAFDHDSEDMTIPYDILYGGSDLYEWRLAERRRLEQERRAAAEAAEQAKREREAAWKAEQAARKEAERAEEERQRPIREKALLRQLLAKYGQPKDPIVPADHPDFDTQAFFDPGKTE
jgi:hypothetical protein